MPHPISSNSPPSCDPNLASCEDAPPVAPPPVAQAPAVVTIAPVTITGDAGARELLRRYDSSQACQTEKQSAKLTCPAIVTGVLNGLEGGPWTGVTSAFYASVLCGKELRSVVDCHEQAEALQTSAAEVVDECHERGGRVSAGASSLELVCEVER